MTNKTSNGDKSHCETAYNSELNRVHLVDVYQNK